MMQKSWQFFSGCGAAVDASSFATHTHVGSLKSTWPKRARGITIDNGAVIHSTELGKAVVSEAVDQPGARGEVTELLLAWGEGRKSALDQLVPLVYPELQRLAHRYLRAERKNHTLQTSGLVNEVFLRLVEVTRVKCRDRAHFLAISAQIMRHILVDFARSRRSHKRGDGVSPIPLDAATDLHQMRSPELVLLDDALNELAAMYPRGTKVIEMRYFGGLSVEETAEALGVSPDTVMRDSRLARAWLYRALSAGSSHDRGHAGETG
jgi:RNA polymerase sigma factor (TIGR02999 family)